MTVTQMMECLPLQGRFEQALAPMVIREIYYRLLNGLGGLRSAVRRSANTCACSKKSGLIRAKLSIQ